MKNLKTHISTLPTEQKNLVYFSLRQNGCDRETTEGIMENGTLKDITDYVDVEDLFEEQY